MNHKTNHLSIEELTDYLEERLQITEIQRIEAHLASGCSACQEELNWLKETFSLMATDDWIDPPDEVVVAVQAKAHRLTKERQEERKSKEPSLIDRLRALFYPKRPIWGGIAFAVVLLLLVITGPFFDGKHEKFTEFEEKHEDISDSIKPQALTDISDSVGPEALSASVSDAVLNFMGQAQFQKKDLIISYDQSGVSLRFFKHIITQLEANTELSLVEVKSSLDENQHTISLFQSSGQSSHVVKPTPELKLSLQIETPVGVIMAEDSEFTVIVNSNGQTKVIVSSGEVNVTAQDTSITAVSGQTIIVEPDQPPSISN